MPSTAESQREWRNKNKEHYKQYDSDRIDPNKDYTVDNVQLLCSQFNDMKTNMTMSELREACKLVLKNTPRDPE